MKRQDVYIVDPRDAEWAKNILNNINGRCLKISGEFFGHTQAEALFNLMYNESVTFLDLSNSRVTADAIKVMSKSLPRTKIEIIHIEDCGLKLDEFAEFKELVRSNPQIVNISIVNNKLIPWESELELAKLALDNFLKQPCLKSDNIDCLIEIDRNDHKVKGSVFDYFRVDSSAADGFVSVFQHNNKEHMCRTSSTKRECTEDFNYRGTKVVAIGQGEYPDYIEFVDQLVIDVVGLVLDN